MSKLTRWVVGSYKGETAKSVLAHAASGVGYQILQQNGSGMALNVVAALRCSIQPLPEHLTEIKDPFKIQKLENQRKK